MSRRNRAKPRTVAVDPIYGSKIVTKLINNVMLDGKKSVAQTIVYNAFEYIQEKIEQGELDKQKFGKNALEAFENALNNVMPALEVKARRVGGANYQVPIEVRAERRLTLALRWIVKYSRDRSEKTMQLRLAKEIIDACNETGASVKKREDMHKMAEANKAFAHYRW